MNKSLPNKYNNIKIVEVKVERNKFILILILILYFSLIFYGDIDFGIITSSLQPLHIITY